MTVSQRVLIDFLTTHSLKRAPEGKPFVLASGKTSMTYLDVRLAALNPTGHHLFGQAIYEVLQDQFPGVEAVAGVVLGGCPLASAVSMTSAARFGTVALPALYVRKEAKQHGTGSLVEGPKRSHMNVVLLEDVVTSGGSSLAAIKTLQEDGLIVIGVIAVVDREAGGRKAIEEDLGIPFISLTTMKQIAR